MKCLPPLCNSFAPSASYTESHFPMLQTLLRNKPATTVFFAAVILGLLTWEATHGGVITHHLMARADMPGFSNWWGLITVPLLAWITLAAVDRRQRINPQQPSKTVVWAFLGALIFGLTLGILWLVGLREVLSKAILLPLVLALFLPVYRPEYLLGFVVGMAYTFGGVLPVIFGLILLALSWVIYHLTRWVGRLLR